MNIHHKNNLISLTILCIGCFLYLATSCLSNNTKKSEDGISVTKIKYDSLTIHKSNKLNDDKYNIIILSNLVDECLFSRNSKTIIKNGIIYILDRSKNKKLVKFDTNGNAISSIGKFGQGPEEYMNITDFDVSDNGDVYLLDAMQNIVLTFNKDGKFISRNSISHNAFGIKQLTDGCFLLGIYPWDEGNSKHSLIKINRSFEDIQNIVLKNKKFDYNYLFQFPEIGESDNGFYSFNYEINNNITILNSNGEICAIYAIDFGASNVPDEEKENVENNNIENYRFIIGGTYYDNNNLWFNLYDKGNYGWVKVDLTNDEATYVNVESNQNYVGFHNGYPIITSNDIDNCPIEISDSIKNLVEKQEYQFIAIHE